MSDVMTPLPFSRLMRWILTEYAKEKSVFGVQKMVHYAPSEVRSFFSAKIEAPFGPAAGPHTQLAQNIVAAYVSGARFFELKTVQEMDGRELSSCIPKPCINALDECYNCEWSTELTVYEALDEYVKAWYACKLLSHELEMGSANGFIFNMSVGYDYAGITSDKVDAFIEGLKDASDLAIWNDCKSWSIENVSEFKRVDRAFIESISPHISQSTALSTMHGCFPEEIERIAGYLIVQKGLNTLVKCNPTLLGYEFTRAQLNKQGFNYIAFDEHHFNEDIQWDKAVEVFKRLKDLARGQGKEFGIKVSNTLPVEVHANELSSKEMYLSGAPLFPLTLKLANRIAEEFKGDLPISFCGGADVRNLSDLVFSGVWPVTMSTNLLKPGGYGRLSQISKVFDMSQWNSNGIDRQKLRLLTNNASENPHYKKRMKRNTKRKLTSSLPLFDCFIGPCRSACPIKQDIPAYLKAVDEGRFVDALAIIVERNPLPFMTGNICRRPCTDKCIRNYYDTCVNIRESKLLAARSAYENVIEGLKPKELSLDRRVAIIGGGPAGLACAYFITRQGIPVTLFERSDSLGGVVRQVMPRSLISDEEIDKDVRLCLAFGAEVALKKEIKSALALTEQGFSDVVIAVGAWQPGRMGHAGRRQVSTDLYKSSGVSTDDKGLPCNRHPDGSCEIKGVWVAGDCAHGPSNIVDAIADAAAVASAISGCQFDRFEANNLNTNSAEALSGRAEICFDNGISQKSHCLECATICEVCCEVCPNRANVAIRVEGLKQKQILHIDAMCNDCGNCAVFCPWQGAPYRDKLTLFWRGEDMESSNNNGFMRQGESLVVRLNGETQRYDMNDNLLDLPEQLRKTILSIRNNFSYLIDD